MDETKAEGLVKVTQALIRPTVTVMFSGAVVYGFIKEMIGAEAFLGLAGMVVGFWFQHREDGKKSDVNNSVG